MNRKMTGLLVLLALASFAFIRFGSGMGAYTAVAARVGSLLHSPINASPQSADVPELTSGVFWTSSGVMLIVDAVFLLLLTWRIRPSRFRQLRWFLTATAAAFWSLFGLALVAVFWKPYYQYIYPNWFRMGGILVFVPLVFAALAFGFHWLSFRLRGNPILVFCLLAGAESLLEHLWGTYGMHILEVPMLQQASAASMLAFSFPEYIFYWCIVIALAALIGEGWRWFNGRRKGGGTTPGGLSQ